MGAFKALGAVKTALLVGATGLIGKQLLTLLLDSDRYDTVKALTRKPIHQIHQKLENFVVDFDQLQSAGVQLKADDIFCCLGTTMKQAGSKPAFKKVDYDYPLAVAKLTKGLGASQYLLVSALGADKNSSVYYNRVKGEVEEAITSVGFDALHIFRPSLLLGPRTEKRSGEGAATVMFKYLGFLIPAKYKAIESFKVARAMLHYASMEQRGIHIHKSMTLQQF